MGKLSVHTIRVPQIQSNPATMPPRYYATPATMPLLVGPDDFPFKIEKKPATMPPDKKFFFSKILFFNTLLSYKYEKTLMNNK